MRSVSGFTARRSAVSISPALLADNLTMHVISAVAEFEREAVLDLLRDRVFHCP